MVGAVANAARDSVPGFDVESSLLAPDVTADCASDSGVAPLGATSLGGPESLIEHRASVEGPESRTPPGLLRLSIGLEHPADLVEDLDQALRGAAIRP